MEAKSIVSALCLNGLIKKARGSKGCWQLRSGVEIIIRHNRKLRRVVEIFDQNAAPRNRNSATYYSRCFRQKHFVSVPLSELTIVSIGKKGFK